MTSGSVSLGVIFSSVVYLIIIIEGKQQTKVGYHYYIIHGTRRRMSSRNTFISDHLYKCENHSLVFVVYIRRVVSMPSAAYVSFIGIHDKIRNGLFAAGCTSEKIVYTPLHSCDTIIHFRAKAFGSKSWWKYISKMWSQGNVKIKSNFLNPRAREIPVNVRQKFRNLIRQQ